ncbi:GFA family protein [Ideonella sp. BN130291]|uniref:GFA family protein n=1 Tax=Ideonella sp. BN130291 TaxID=3112940 RepID=UPI002E26F1C3|nr:GFA family protein [Ideonella sp. BN130291]
MEPGVLCGGCFCGAVRYAVQAVFDAGYCHCSICRRISGAGAVCWFSVREEHFRVTRGHPQALHSSEHFTRYFCGACGTHLYGTDDLPPPPKVGSRLVSAMLGTLDEPELVPPRIHQWWSSRMRWYGDAAGLPTFDTGRISHPDERPVRS